MILFILIYAFQASAHPTELSLESSYLEKLKSARGPEAVQGLNREFDSIQLLKRVCDSQIDQGLIPWSCYRALRKSGEWRTIEPRDATEQEKRLDQACKSAARDAIGMTFDFLEGPESDLSPECRRVVLKARSINSYRSQVKISTPGLGHGAILESKTY
jgi:hypothetical protein